MYALLLIFVAMFLAAGCKEENITQIISPQDWQPPVVTWLSPPDADVRGTVGLDVSVEDSSQVTEVRLYLDGREQDTVFASPYRFQLLTDSLPDGVHLCEARAWDQYENLGISPVLRVNVANSIAQGPRLLWVPDSFQTIQAAINAATDYDTIRVRDGAYSETLNLFGKGIWMESEHGPTRCSIDAAGSWSAIYVPGSRATITIRGFWLRGGDVLLGLEEASVNVSNNVLWSDSTHGLLHTYYAGGSIANNLLHGSEYAAVIAYHWGEFSNNIIEHALEVALFNSAIYRNPLLHHYNAFWLNEMNYAGFSQETGEFEADPLIDLSSGRLLPGSPCIDTGDPGIHDLDGSRSDIGPFGGPLGYR